MSDEKKDLLESVWPPDALRAFVGVDVAKGPDATVFGTYSGGTFAVVGEARDALTFDEIAKAVDRLREANVSPFEGGYHCFVSPPTLLLFRRADEGVRLDQLLHGRPERVRLTAWEVFDHECRRQDLNKRDSDPTARECFDRALRVEELGRG